MFDLIDGRARVLSDLIQAYPNQHRTSDMIALRPLRTALTRFQAGYLFGCTMKLLNFPTNGTLLPSSIGGRLSLVVGDTYSVRQVDTFVLNSKGVAWRDQPSKNILVKFSVAQYFKS